MQKQLVTFFALAMASAQAFGGQLYVLGIGEGLGIGRVPVVDEQGQYIYISGSAGSGSGRVAKLWRFNTSTLEMDMDVTLAYPAGPGQPWHTHWGQAVSSHGVMTGSIWNPVDFPNGGPYAYAFSMPNQMTDIYSYNQATRLFVANDINDGLMIVGRRTTYYQGGFSLMPEAGYAESPTGSMPLVSLDWDQAAFVGSSANACNQGVHPPIVGYSAMLSDWTFLPVRRATLWTWSTLLQQYVPNDLGTLDEENCDDEAFDVNEVGMIVGQSIGRPFYKEPGRDMDWIAQLTGVANAVSDGGHGWVVGEAFNGGQSPVPYFIKRDGHAHGFMPIHWMQASNGWTPITAKDIDDNGQWIVGTAVGNGQVRAYIYHIDEIY